MSKNEFAPGKLENHIILRYFFLHMFGKRIGAVGAVVVNAGIGASSGYVPLHRQTEM
jgi:hypothetical protein